MIEDIKILLGDAASNFTDAQIALCSRMAIAEVESYCHRELDYELEIIAARIAIIKLNKLGNEGLLSHSYSGISESFTDGYPADIQYALNSKRRLVIM